MGYGDDIMLKKDRRLSPNLQAHVLWELTAAVPLATANVASLIDALVCAVGVSTIQR